MTAPDARNLLADETSPYLLLHKDDPVHWRPWGQAALDEAKAAGKPILLSSGFTACHWCHVMQAESFKDPAIAEVMNANFVCIKLDREERPEIDQLYQTSVQALGQQGGWPLTVFLSPDGVTFTGSTYHPVEDSLGRVSWRKRLNDVIDAWTNRRPEVDRATVGVREALERAWNSDKPELINSNIIEPLARRLTQRIDLFFGGFEGQPKFPQTPNLNFIWRAFLRSGAGQFSNAVVTSLDNICQGGIYDHLGGGFHRYAVDERWLVPHFEKMVQDNALLIETLTLIWPMVRSPLYAARIDETIDWVLREMVTSDGAFASSLDSDSEGKEGTFYVWPEAEIDAVLGPNDAPLFKQVYGVTPGDNWDGNYILNRLGAMGFLRPDQEAVLTRCRRMLMMERTKRTRPLRDDKAMPDANGAMIAALAQAGAVFKKPEWHFAAVRAFWTIVEKLGEEDRLAQSFCGGRRNSAEATAEGYAHMSRAAMILFEFSSDTRYIDKARAWMDRLESHFSDKERGGYYFSSVDATDALVRIRTGLDITTPSYSGVIAEVLWRIAYLTGDEDYRKRANDGFAAFGAEIHRQPQNTATMLNALEFALATVHVVIIGDERSTDTQALVRAVLDRSVPCRILTIMKPTQKLNKDHPAFGKSMQNGMATAYVCIGATCSDPVVDPAALAQGLMPLPIVQQMNAAQMRAQQQAQIIAANQARAANANR